jgi:hypothetical protein
MMRKHGWHGTDKVILIKVKAGFRDTSDKAGTFVV